MRLSTALAALVVGGGLVATAVHLRARQPQPSAAAPSFDRDLLPSNPTGGPLWDSAVGLWNLGAFAEAASIFAAGETGNPRDAAWPQALAECHSAMGQHQEALDDLERCRAIAPLAPEAAFRQRTSRLALGFAKAGSGDPWTARQLADVVLQTDPGDSLALLLQGYAWAMEGALPRAEEVLGKLVAAHPGQVEAYPLLVQCAFRRGDADAADRWIARLGKLEPDHEGLALWKEQAGELRSGRGAFSSRLRVTCDGTCPLGMEREVLDASEQAWTALTHDIGRAPAEPVSIRIVADGNMPTEWAEAVYDGQVRLPLPVAQDAQERVHVLRHELAHAFLVDFSGGRIPLWLNEGLAQWLEGRRPESLPDARTAAWLDDLPGRANFMDLSADDAELAYAYSLAVTTELMTLHGSIATLRYLDLLAGGSSEPTCFQQAFGRTYPELSARIRARM